MSKFKIQNDVAIPSIVRVSSYPFAEMNIGDSFEVDAALGHNVRSAAHQFSKSHAGYKFTTRKTSAGGMRVWRIDND